ncbi:NAD-dependent epimerase/dehydratase family protein [Aquamicrobium sp. LC103]|uniref:NAD-dependent epimerase/dehydratase family protein n=1 Tax=Aquamicrobium sp. LC103 TaxID=1120658 RepID=UPI00063E74A4|nr:NAD-dependent epimerase/dehydratase family protein [Aquamicrobium sp. LC103]TKT80185.1 NAD-dependent epimerase/dehydratase family protein [Aquamicrobium sp. LC103]
MKVLLTGAAGFIGHHVAHRMLERGDEVVGLDNMSDYYSPALKAARNDRLARFERFSFLKLDLADHAALQSAGGLSDLDLVVHLAAQPGVRHSMENPFPYVEANVMGQVSLLEFAAKRGLPLVYASSSSVYGANEVVPFREGDRVDRPISLYAATKRAGELLAHSYRHTHGLRAVGLRFFTVYGRYGRPDMAPWLFTDAILHGKPITVFNNGEMERDFTHVSDVARGVTGAADRILAAAGEMEPLYNLGDNRSVPLMDFIALVEKAAGRKAKIEFKPRPPGDVPRTYADIALAECDLGFKPTVVLEDGIADFVEWFREEANRF